MDCKLFRMICALAIVPAGALCGPTAIADEFSWQVAGGHDRSEYENRSGLSLVRDDGIGIATRSETDTSTLRATYYLSPVDDADVPNELAPFLSRSGHVSLLGSRSRQRFGTEWVGAVPGGLFLPEPSTTEFDTSGYAFSGRYVWSGTGWYLGGGVDRSDTDTSPNLPYSETRMETSGYGLSVGKYIGRRTSVTLRVRSDTQLQVEEFDADRYWEWSSDERGWAPLTSFLEDWTSTSESDSEGVDLSVRHVGELRDLAYSVAGGVGAMRWDHRAFVLGRIGPPVGVNTPTSSERQREYSVSGAIYPRPSLDIRVAFSRTDPGRDRVGVSVGWYFVHRMSAQLEIARSGIRDVPGELSSQVWRSDIDSVSASLLGRF